MSKEMTKKENTLEEDFADVSDIIEQLSDPDVEIEKAIELYTKGMNLLSGSKRKLDLVEKKVMKLNKDMSLEEFKGEDL